MKGASSTAAPIVGRVVTRLSTSASRGSIAVGAGLVLLAGMAGARCLPYVTGAVQPVVFEQLVLPQLLASLLAGAGLGAGGTILQGLTRNPMASPGLLGVTAGAHLFIVVALVAFDAQLSLVLAGFAGSLVALVVTWFLAGPSGRHGAVLALAGVAVTLAFTAAASALTLLNEQQVGGAFLWSAGAPLMAGWDVLAQLGPFIAAGLALAAAMVRGLDLLALGSVMARSLSASPARLTTIGFTAVGLMAGAAVALTGPVSFIGLVAPNALRRLGVRRHAWLLPASALWGAVLLVGADWLVRLLATGGESIPVGVVTAVVGAPLFLALIAGLTHGGEATGFGAGRRWQGTVWIGGTLWLVVAWLSLSIGQNDLAPWELLRALASADAEGGFVVRELRLPRLLVASTAGALLALAGAVLQAVLRNPLAGPETLGIVQGAALCSVFALLAGAHPGGWAMQASALAGGAGAVAVVFAVARRAGMSPVPLVLAGITLASLLSSLAALAVMKADLQATQALVWVSGSVYARGWGDWFALLPATALVGALVWWLAPSLDLLGLGDTKARALGLAVPSRRALACCLAALATAASVSVVGSLAFVGLLAPHMARMLSGGCLRPRLPLIVFCGAGLTAVADLAGRTVIAPSQLPAGIMTSLVGAPYFLWLLRATRRGRG